MAWFGFWIALAALLIVGANGPAKIDCAIGVQAGCVYLTEYYAPKKD